LGSIFLYVFAALFVVYLAFGEMEGRTWVTLFWIVVLFASVNAVLKSFAQEDQDRRIYYYTLCDPYSVIIAKLCYNFCVLLMICLISLVLFSLITRFPISATGIFATSVVLGALGIAANFTFVSTIASHTRNSNTMMMILSLPVIIPLLLPLIRISVKSVGPLTWKMAQSDLSMLVAVDLIIVALLMLLFPFVWRE
jgi:heme exporter protein B